MVLADRSLVPLNFSDYQDRTKVVSNEFQVIALAVLLPATGEWQCKVQASVGKETCTIRGTAASAVVAVASAFDEAAAWIQAETAIQADPVALLERALKSHDWYSHFSDDPASYNAGAQSWQKITALTDQVLAADVFRLWQQYAPDDAFFPLLWAPSSLRNAASRDDIEADNIHAIRKLPLCRSTDYEAWHPDGDLTRVDELETLPGWGKSEATIFALTYDADGDDMPVWVPVEVSA